MDWNRLGQFYTAWSQAVDGKHSLYIRERSGDWLFDFAVSRSKGLMLAEQSAQESVSSEELAGFRDVAESARRLAAKMESAFQ